MDGLLYVYLNVSTDANIPQYATSATILVDLNLTGGTAIYSRDYDAEVLPLAVTVPFKSGTHKVSHPIILLVPGGGTFRIFSISIVATRAEGSHNKRYVAKIGQAKSKIVTIIDNSREMTSASHAASISLTSTVLFMSKLSFFNTYYRLYQISVGAASGVPSQNVVISGVKEVGNSTQVKTLIYTGADESTDALIAVSKPAFVQTISSMMGQNSGTAVYLTISKAQVRLNCNEGMGAEWITAVGCRCQRNFFGNGSLLQCQPCPLLNGTVQTLSAPGSTECVVRTLRIVKSKTAVFV
jgi:hypothetical protein